MRDSRLKGLHRFATLQVDEKQMPTRFLSNAVPFPIYS